MCVCVRQRERERGGGGGVSDVDGKVVRKLANTLPGGESLFNVFDILTLQQLSYSCCLFY